MVGESRKRRLRFRLFLSIFGQKKAWKREGVSSRLKSDVLLVAGRGFLDGPGDHFPDPAAGAHKVIPLQEDVQYRHRTTALRTDPMNLHNDPLSMMLTYGNSLAGECYASVTALLKNG